MEEEYYVDEDFGVRKRSAGGQLLRPGLTV